MDEITELEEAGRAVPDELREELGRLIDAEEPHDVTLIGARGRLDRLWLKTMHDRTVALVMAHRQEEANNAGGKLEEETR